MTTMTLSQDVCLKPTRTSAADAWVQSCGETDTRTEGEVYFFEDYLPALPAAPQRYTEIDDLVAEFEQDSQARQELDEARRWVGETFYGGEGDTIRTMRLRKGWSQAHLAEMLASSQPHVARIESGASAVVMETARKLAQAFGVDMNTIDKALTRQGPLTKEGST